MKVFLGIGLALLLGATLLFFASSNEAPIGRGNAFDVPKQTKTSHEEVAASTTLSPRSPAISAEGSQGDASALSQRSIERAIEGQVREYGTSMPIQGARILVVPAGVPLWMNADSHSAVSDAAGRFSLPHREGGDYRVRVRSDGYVPQSATVPLSSGKVAPVLIELVPTTEVRIRCVEARDGVPIPGAKVEIAPDRLDQLMEFTKNTDSDGYAVFEEIASTHDPASWRVRFSAEGFFFPHAELEAVDLFALLQPLSKVPADARWFSRVDGEGGKAHFEVRFFRCIAIEGAVFQPDGQRCENALVFYAPLEGELDGFLDPFQRTTLVQAGSHRMQSRSTITDESGRFRLFPVPTVPYAVSAFHPDFGLARRVPILPTPPGGTARSDVFFESSSGRIRGKVLDPHGAELSQTLVWLFSDSNVVVGKTTSDSEGKFEFHAPAGKYAVFASNREFDSPPKIPVEIFSNATGALDVRLLPKSAGIRGVALDGSGNPLVDYSVSGIEWGFSKRAGRILNTTTGPDGRFCLSGLTPGEKYEVTLGYPVGYVPDPRSRVVSSDDANCDFRLWKTGSIAGQVSQWKARSVDALIWLQRESGSKSAEGERFQTPDAEGFFRFRDLPPGRYRFGLFFGPGKKSEMPDSIDLREGEERSEIMVDPTPVKGG